MDPFLDFLRELSRRAISAEWELLGTTVWGFCLVPAVGALVGWSRRAEHKSMRAVRNAFVDAAGASIIVFILVFLLEFCWSVPHKITTSATSVTVPKATWKPPDPPVSPEAESAGTAQSKADALRERTNKLASDIFWFVYHREGPISEWKQQAIAQSVISTMEKNDQDGTQFRARLNSYNRETLQLFIQSYVPRLVSLMKDLTAEGADTSPINAALRTNDPRKIALMLSVVSERIGMRPPYGLTPSSVQFGV